MEYYSASKKQLFVVTCTNPDNMVLFEISQRKKMRYVFSLVHEIQHQWIYLWASVHKENKAVVTKGRRKWECVGERIKYNRWAGWGNLKIGWTVVHNQHCTQDFSKDLNSCSCYSGDGQSCEMKSISHSRSHFTIFVYLPTLYYAP